MANLDSSPGYVISVVVKYVEQQSIRIYSSTDSSGNINIIYEPVCCKMYVCMYVLCTIKVIIS